LVETGGQVTPPAAKKSGEMKPQRSPKKHKGLGGSGKSEVGYEKFERYYRELTGEMAGGVTGPTGMPPRGRRGISLRLSIT